MNNIKYVRTLAGIIGAFIRENADDYIIKELKTEFTIPAKKQECTVTNNKLNLIKVGDVVNGFTVLEIEDIDDDERKAFTILISNGTQHMKFWAKEDIETILTREQFEREVYRI